MKKLLFLFVAILSFSHAHSNNLKWSSPPTVLSGVSTNASDPQIAIDTQGNAVAVWIENNQLKAGSQIVNSSWTSDAIASIANVSSPRIVSDQNGSSTAVWIENGVIKAASKHFGGSWGAYKTLSSSGASTPSLAVDANGNVIAVWTRNGDIETSTKLFGQSWQARVTINSKAAVSPVVTIGGPNSNTRAAIAWQGTSGGNSVVFFSTKLINGSWSSAQIISETGHKSAQPFVAVDANANALAIWYDYEITGFSYTNVVVKSAARPANGTWGPVTSLSTPGIRNPSTLVARIAFDKIGNAIALWNTSFDDETFSIQSAVKPVNGTWSETIELVNSNLYAHAAELSTTSFGDVLGLYLFYNGASLMIQSIESDINGYLNNFWSVPVTISLGAENAYPKIAASLSGNVIHAAAIWTNHNGLNNSVVASSGNKTLVSPPSNLSVVQQVHNFGVFNEYYNTLSWQASTDPNAAGYLIFRNGTFLEQVGVDVTQYVDNNRTQNSPVNYSVTAIDSQQTQSTTISINFP